MSTPLRQLVDAISGFAFPADHCLYCGSTGPSQQDHFPIPEALGGMETVRACLHCHNMKDRAGDGVAMDWMLSQAQACELFEVTAEEGAFLFGRLSLLPDAARALIDDLREFPAPMRIMIGRRLRRQLYGMARSGGPQP